MMTIISSGTVGVSDNCTLVLLTVAFFILHFSLWAKSTDSFQKQSDSGEAEKCMKEEARDEKKGRRELSEKEVTGRETERVTEMANAYTVRHTHICNDHFEAFLLLLAGYPWNPITDGGCHVWFVCVQMVLTRCPSQGRWSKWSYYINDRHTHLSHTSAWLPALFDTHTCTHRRRHTKALLTRISKLYNDVYCYTVEFCFSFSFSNLSSLLTPQAP